MHMVRSLKCKLCFGAVQVVQVLFPVGIRSGGSVKRCSRYDDPKGPTFFFCKYDQ